MRKSQFFRLLSIIIAVLIISVAGFYCFKNIKEHLDKQVEDNIQDVSKQNAIVLCNELNGIHDILLGMAEEMKLWKDVDIEEVLNQLLVYNDVYSFVRIGFVYPDGTAYLSDGNKGNFANEEYFKNSMNGSKDISKVLNDVFNNGEEINIFSVPVYKEEGGNVEGVLLAVCETKNFMEYLNVKSFSGSGDSFVVESDGSIISRSEIDDSIEILFTDEQNSKENRKISKQIKEDMANNRTGHVVFRNDENEKLHMYYMPLQLELENHNWYIFTSVPESAINNRITSVIEYVSILLGVFIGALCIVGAVYFYSYLLNSKKLAKLAYVDKITGGDNYASFIEKLNNIKLREGYIISVGIEEFHIINTVCGVETGNETLKMMSKSMTESLNEQEFCAHVHSDRFILFFNETSRGNVISRIGQITQKIVNIENELNVPKIIPHFGICFLNKDDDIESVYEQAKQAKYTIKNSYTKNYCFVDELDIKKMEEDKIIEDEFDDAILNKRFEVWYQPKYDPTDNTIVSAEALVRLRDKEGNLISPGRFIPIFEGNGKISELDEYVFKEVCELQKRWKNGGRKLVPISVNISRASLYYGDIVDRYRVILESFELDLNDVQIEITESATANDVDVHNLVNQFHNVGFTLSLDDFGSGYSSLATLNELHFDILKLDKSLIDYIGEANGEKLLYHIIQLAKGIGLKITAEGVETKNQVEFLVKLKCDDIQGYYFSKPLPCVEFEKILYS